MKETESMVKLTFIRSTLAAAVWLACGHSAFAAVDLPKLNIDKTQTTVSGLSSGGFMAVQLHVAYSATFAKGAGIVAGGPFHCAEGSIVNATGRCMASPAGIPTSTLINTTSNWASQGFIDPVSNLQTSKVYLFSGSKDTTVVPGVMDAQTIMATPVQPKVRPTSTTVILTCPAIFWSTCMERSIHAMTIRCQRGTT